MSNQASARTALPVVEDTGAVCCAPGGAALTPERATELAPMFKALGDPVRLRLASMIAASAPEACVCDLSAGFDLSQPTISHHLKVLREAGLVDCERRGTWVWYWIRPDALRTLAVFLGGVPTAG